MRNQFFGDINDYHKYGLLRTLAGDGDLKVGVCWMLTPDDGRHGNKTGYLLDPIRWQKFDAEPFARLHEWLVVHQTRQVSLLEGSDLIPGASYYSCVIPELRRDRELYFERMSNELKHSHLIFFDPDNGLEVPGKPYTGKPSRQHLYFREARSAFQTGHSVLCIQFFPRKKRDEYIEARAQEIHLHLSVRPLCLRTTNVAYFLAMQESHARILTSRVDLACQKWSPEIRLCASAPLRETALSCP